jgi:phosphoribosylformimino-5-aminoimidazole carboxamide ribotide isomerase
MRLYCAIDLRAGQAVRLVQGDFGRERRYGDPVALARHFVEEGADRLHVVDLDAAVTGVAVNRPVVAAIIEQAGVPVQVSGGVRSEDDVAELVEMGAARVVVGTVALRRPEVLRSAAERFPGVVALALDHRRRPDGMLEPAISGWLEPSGTTVLDQLAHWRGVPLAAVVATAIERDGTGVGPDLAAIGQVLEASEVPVVASGGVGSLADLAALGALRSADGRRLEGVVVGTALVEGAFGVAEAVRACASSG